MHTETSADDFAIERIAPYAIIRAPDDYARSGNHV